MGCFTLLRIMNKLFHTYKNNNNSSKSAFSKNTEWKFHRQHIKEELHHYQVSIYDTNYILKHSHWCDSYIYNLLDDLGIVWIIMLIKGNKLYKNILNLATITEIYKLIVWRFSESEHLNFLLQKWMEVAKAVILYQSINLFYLNWQS